METSSESPAIKSEVEQAAERAERFDLLSTDIPDTIGAVGGGKAGEVVEDEIDESDLEISDDFTDDELVSKDAVRYYLQTAFEELGEWTQQKEMALTPLQLRMATPVTYNLVRKWTPYLLGKSQYKEEIAFAIVMSGIVGPRLRLLKKATSTDGKVTRDA